MISVEDENDSSSDSSANESSCDSFAVDEEIKKEQELLKQVKKLEYQLDTNKYLYDVHVQVINVYRKLTDLSSMREAYQRFHECFPLAPKLWLEWIRDEIKIADTKDEQQRVLELFEKAVDDYLSVDLWLEYVQYSIGVNNLETTRIILEKGLTSAGLHVSKGSLLWDNLRELENAHISLHQKDSNDWVNQVKRVAEVFKRQLSVPLLNMENTYEEWTEWFKTLPDGLIDPKNIDWGYKKALQVLESYKPFEDKLLSAEETELFDIYKEYIKIVKDPLTVLCLYERAVADLCLSPNLWEDYINFSFKMEEAVLTVTKKAVRNCPWSEELWVARLRTLENYKKEEKDVVACFEEGLTSLNLPPLNFWFCFLEYHHRNSKDTSKTDKLFYKALQQLEPDYDQTFKLRRWYARLIAKRGDILQARKIWKEIIANPSIKGSANAWLEYANLEKQYGEMNQVRNIFKQALTSCKDWAQYIGEEWMMFEREVGSLENVMKCEHRCKDVIKSIPEQTKFNTESISDKREKPIRNQKRKHNDNNEDFNFKKLKVSQDRERKKDKSPLPSTSKIIEKDPKTTVFVSNLHPKVTEKDLKELFTNASNISVVFDRKGKSRCFGYIQFSKEEEAMTALARDRVPIDGRPVFISELKSEKGERKKEFKYSTTIEENKLFVKGLPLSKSREEIEKIFKPYNPIDIRLVCKRNGQPKGIAFVEFKTKEEAQKALELNSTKIDDCELSVAISAPPQKKIGDNEEQQQSEPIRHSRSRLQVPLMIPRTLQVKSNPEKQKNDGNSDSVSTGLKSNADFRNMFLKK